MTQEHETRPPYLKTADVFGLTNKEQFYDFISDTHFQDIVQTSETTIHQLTVDTNEYGEFLFVTVSREVVGKPRFMTFWGLGYHEKRERWLTQEWRFHESYIRNFPAAMPKETALNEIQRRRDEIAEEAVDTAPSQRAILFALLADLTDEDGAITELDDLSSFGNLFDDE